MLYINESKGNFRIETDSIEFNEDYIPVIIEKPRQITFMGKNNLFDNFYSHRYFQESLSFNGKKVYEFINDAQFELYELEGQNGYVFHHFPSDNVVVSKSFNLINSYTLHKQNFSFYNEFNKHLSTKFKFKHEYVNFDLLPDGGKSLVIDNEKHGRLDLKWDDGVHSDTFHILIEIEGAHIDREGQFYEEFKGKMVGIGDFRFTALKNLPDGTRLPDFFPEAECDRSIVITNLIDDNAEKTLVPRIISEREYQFFIEFMKANKQKTTTISGTTPFGFNIQAQIEVLPEELSTYEYKAKINSLVISPNYITPHTVTFRDN